MLYMLHLTKFYASKTTTIVNIQNSNNRCFEYAVCLAIKDLMQSHTKSEAGFDTEHDFLEHRFDKLNYYEASTLILNCKAASN